MLYKINREQIKNFLPSLSLVINDVKKKNDTINLTNLLKIQEEFKFAISSTKVEEFFIDYEIAKLMKNQLFKLYKKN